MGSTSQFFRNSSHPAEYKMLQQQNILKRKRSFKRRRFMEDIACVSLAIMLVMTQNFNTAQAVPAMGSGFLRLYGNAAAQQQQLARYIRDVSASLSTSQLQQYQHQQQKENLKDSSQQSSSTEVSLEQPQGQCLLDGEYVPETTVFCEKQEGCRAIQKTGHCCPDYTCDCQKDGKTYSNGDKLVDPETPCTVCYCQGGEILCSSVSCFHRDDCTPQYIPGVCCPEYDNCPVATSESTANKTLLLTTTTTAKPSSANNPRITIKEITKRIEIRIMNDKTIPIQQMLKPSSTSTTSTTSTTTTTTTTTPAPAPIQTMLPISPSTTATTASPATLSTQASAISTTPIPHMDTIKENATTNIDHNQHSVESSESLSGDNNHQVKKAPPSTVLVPVNVISTLASLDSSTEVEDPVPALSIFSTQGLPEDPSKVNIKREYFVTTQGVVSGPSPAVDGFGSGEYANSELIFSQPAQGQSAFTAAQQQSSAELDPDTAGSDNIYHIILTTDGPRLTSTSENYLALKGVSTTEVSAFDDLLASSLSPVEPNNNLQSGKGETSTTERSTKQGSSTELIVHQHLEEEDSAIQLESNPAYPSLPEDDFSLRDDNFQINESDDVGDEPRSIGGSHAIASNFDAIKSTKHLDEHTVGSGSGSGSGMFLDELAVLPSSPSSTEGSGDLGQSTESYDKLKSSSPSALAQFMYSGEDSSEETTITNATDFKMEKHLQKSRKAVDTSFESAETSQQIDFETGSGSGSGEIQLPQQAKEREPTTPRPSKNPTNIDIDSDFQDASGNGPHDDPKLDVESLKLDETANDTPHSISNKSAKNIIPSI